MRRNSNSQILLVEDVELEAKLVMRALADAGYSNVAHAADSKSALARIEADDIRLVITDVGLGGASGVDLTRQLRARENCDYVYVIALTSRGGEGAMQECFDAGVDDFVKKPLNRIELVSRLRAGERIVELERRFSRKSYELETALRRIDVTAAQRALARAEQAVENAVVPGSTPLQTLAGTTTWRDVESHFAKVTGEYFQLPFESAPLADDVASPFVAEISLSEPTKQLEIGVAVAVDPSTMASLSMHLLGEDDRETSQALVLELANTLMGVLKATFANHAFAFTGGLPSECTMEDARKAFDATTVRTRLAIGRSGAHIEIWLHVKEKRNSVVRGRTLTEGLVICQDIHDLRGMLLMRAGSRLTQTGATRLAAAVPDLEVEVTTPSV